MLSGKSLNRPGLARALDACKRGEAAGIIVSKLDRLSRSLLDFAALMERSQKEGWSIVALDLGVDTTTPQGEMLINILATFAQFERRLISQRTKDGLAIKAAQGVHIGRPGVPVGELGGRIRSMRENGLSLARIAQTLNEEGVSTLRGGREWRASSVQALLRRKSGD